MGVKVGREAYQEGVVASSWDQVHLCRRNSAMLTSAHRRCVGPTHYIVTVNLQIARTGRRRTQEVTSPSLRTKLSTTDGSKQIIILPELGWAG